MHLHRTKLASLLWLGKLATSEVSGFFFNFYIVFTIVYLLHTVCRIFNGIILNSQAPFKVRPPTSVQASQQCTVFWLTYLEIPAYCEFYMQLEFQLPYLLLFPQDLINETLDVPQRRRSSRGMSVDYSGQALSPCSHQSTDQTMLCLDYFSQYVKLYGGSMCWQNMHELPAFLATAVVSISV